ncbi:MAG: D-inositol 3-phosphate glycosyltransferase [Acidimicrobiaceae bacterium]|nr:D-inositol 3-phosphate glycosyltransferase [Acidimicrobiaceae bacterium]
MHTSPLDQPGVGDSGGLNVYVRELAASMAGRGVDCDIYVRRTNRDVPEVVALEPGVNVIQIEAGPYGLEKEDLPAVVDAWTHGVANYLEKRPVEAFHAHYWLSGMVGHQLKHAFDLPLAVTFHTLGRIKSIAGEAESKDRIQAEEAVIGCADAVFASGSVEADQLTSLYGIPRDRIEILTPGVDRGLFKPGSPTSARRALGLSDGPVLLFVGRIQAFKGLDVAIDAVGLSKNSDAQLVVVGGLSGDQGPETYRDIKRRIKRHELQERVIFVEPQPHQLLPTYYQAADVCLVPSRSESFGLVALEAAACGVPVVASSVGGLRDNVVDGVTGLLVDERDPAKFAVALDELLERPDLRRSMGHRGVERAALHSWELGASNAIEVFGRLTLRELVSCA